MGGDFHCVGNNYFIHRILKILKHYKIMIETKLSQAVVAAVKSLYGLEVEESAVQLQKTRSEFEGEEYAQKRLQLNRDLEREISDKGVISSA